MIQTIDKDNFGDLIYKRYVFVVPPYQRGYAWGDEEIADFCRDLKGLYDERRNGKQRQHFFGGLVSIDKSDPSSNIHRYEVVDGQQRLATFSLLLALIVKEMEILEKQAQSENNNKLSGNIRFQADQIKSSYLEYKDVEDGVPVTKRRVILSKADKDFFERLVSNSGGLNPSRASHQRLLNAWQSLEKELVKNITSDKHVPLEDKFTRLLTLRDAVLEDCFVIHVVSNDKAGAYQLFMTLNDRGRRLSAGDLLRTHTMELLEPFPTEQKKVESDWDEILQESETQVEKFLRAYLPSHKGIRAGRQTLYDDFCKQFFPSVSSHKDAKDMTARIDSMREEARLFNAISDGEWPYSNNPKASRWQQDRLDRLIKILKHALCLPLLLAASRELSEADFSQLVSLLERFVFRYITICGAHPGKVQEVYYQHCVKIRQGQPAPLKELQTALADLITKYASDTVFEANLPEKLRYSPATAQVQVQDGKIIKHFLTTLEDYKEWCDKGARGTPRPDMTDVHDLRMITIEHIYPQNPKRRDPNLEPLKHDLGNLTFWSPDDNRGASNEDFQNKKTAYAGSNISLNRDLAKLDSWDTTQVDQRRKKLVEMALKIFRV